MQDNSTTNTKTTVIQAYDLVGLLQEVQKAALEGYRIDLESNDNYPRQIGTAYLLGMVKVEAEKAKEVRQEAPTTAVEALVEVQQDQDKGGKQRGRSGKVT